MAQQRIDSGRRSHLRAAGLLAGAAAMAWALGGCAQLAGPRSVTYSQAELQQMLDRKFPQERRLLEVLDVTLLSPALELLPERNRVALSLQVQAGERLFASSVRGRLALESGLRLDPRDASIRLVQVRVTSLTWETPDGAPPRLPVQRLGSVLAEKLLEGTVLHQLKPEQLERLTRAGYQPGTLEVTPSGLTISVVPAK